MDGWMDLSICLSIYPCEHVGIDLLVCLFSVCLSIYLSIYPSIHLSIHLHTLPHEIACQRAYVHTYIHTYILTYIHAHACYIPVECHRPWDLQSPGYRWLELFAAEDPVVSNIS